MFGLKNPLPITNNPNPKKSPVFVFIENNTKLPIAMMIPPIVMACRFVMKWSVNQPPIIGVKYTNIVKIP
ncbi:Uncharacterised protein [Streptococcus pneumoniae]|nr:Uncharacterised protein [Streptococcus pneumoniae]